MKRDNLIVFFNIALFILSLFGQLQAQSARKDETLILNKEKVFFTKSGIEKSFVLNLKKDDFTEIFYSSSIDRIPRFSLITPSGKDIFENIYQTGSIPFVAHETGKYELAIKFEGFDDNEDKKNARVGVSYSNVFRLPKIIRLTNQKQVNGYNIKTYVDGNDTDGSLGSYLLIYKNRKLAEILKGDSVVGGGFNFSEKPSEDAEAAAEAKKSADLIRTTIDKTGDGTPDIAVSYYTGGAHCCFDMHFYELGKDGVRKIKAISGEDSEIIAIGKQTDGSLILKTGDSNFAYWKTCFACSPLPTIILTYQKGEFRPNLKMMSKSAPSSEALSRKAEEYKRKMDLKPYLSDKDGEFAPVFWEEMVDLLYTGNETAAWQFFDMVWDKQKPGKEKFKEEFLEKLNESEWWQMMKNRER